MTITRTACASQHIVPLGYREAGEDTVEARSPGAPEAARFGAVIFVHRFGSALNANLTSPSPDQTGQTVLSLMPLEFLERVLVRGFVNAAASFASPASKRVAC